jgi:hypothetical protein
MYNEWTGLPWVVKNFNLDSGLALDDEVELSNETYSRTRVGPGFHDNIPEATVLETVKNFTEFFSRQIKTEEKIDISAETVEGLIEEWLVGAVIKTEQGDDVFLTQRNWKWQFYRLICASSQMRESVLVKIGGIDINAANIGQLRQTETIFVQPCFSGDPGVYAAFRPTMHTLKYLNGRPPAKRTVRGDSITAPRNGARSASKSMRRYFATLAHSADLTASNRIVPRLLFLFSAPILLHGGAHSGLNFMVMGEWLGVQAIVATGIARLRQTPFTSAVIRMPFCTIVLVIVSETNAAVALVTGSNRPSSVSSTKVEVLAFDAEGNPIKLQGASLSSDWATIEGTFEQCLKTAAFTE